MFSEYKTPFIISIIGHAFLLLVSAFSWQSSSPSAPMTMAQPMAENVEIVKAVAVDEVAVQAEMDRLAAEKEKQRQAELAKQRELERQAEAAKKKREQEAKKLAELEAQAKKLKQQQAAEQKRLAEIKQQTEAEEKKRKEEEARQAEAQRKQQEEAQKQQAEIAAAKQRQLQEVVQRYSALIYQAIGRQWIIPDNIDPSLSSTLLIRLAPGGSVIDVQIVESSGNPQLDRSAMAAVYKASPLPVPREEEWFERFREVRLTVRPEEVVRR